MKDDPVHSECTVKKLVPTDLSHERKKEDQDLYGGDGPVIDADYPSELPAPPPTAPTLLRRYMD